VRWIWLAVFAPCGGRGPADEGVDDSVHDSAIAPTDACADYTWETVGAPVVLTWCTPCHSVDLPLPQRQGAPMGVNFDDADDVLTQAQRVRARATGDTPTMPPLSGPDADERNLLLAWIDCETR
jgi:uncharacterized membrane protein